MKADFALMSPHSELDHKTSSDVRLVPPSNEPDETYASLIQAYSVHCMKT